MSYLLDTNVISEFRLPMPDANVDAWLQSVDEEKTFISVASIAEIRRGAALLAEGRRKQSLLNWLQEILTERFRGRVLDVTPEVALLWGDLMAHARQNGFGLSIMDAFLAASARVHALRVVTRNVRDFERLNLEVINPWQPRDTR